MENTIYFHHSENRKKYQSLWDAKNGTQWNIIEVNTYIKKKKSLKSVIPKCHLKSLGKEQQVQ